MISRSKGKFMVDLDIMSQSIPTGYIPPGNPRGLALKTCPRVRDLTLLKVSRGPEIRQGPGFCEK